MKLIQNKLAHFFACIVLLLFTAGHISAQKDKIDWEDDVITVNGKPYAKMTRKTVGLLAYEFSVSGLSGPELIYLKPVPGEWYYDATSRKQVQRWHHEINFIGSGSKATLDLRTSGDAVGKMIVENKLILNNAIDPDAERRFIQVYNGFTPTSETPQPASPMVVVNVNNAPSTPAAPAPVAAKSKSPVVLDGGNILRDGETIGKFREGATVSAYSQKTRLITVYNDGGEKVAEADAPVDHPQEWTIKILSDGKILNLLYDSPGELENLFKWLADKGYLSN